MRRLLLAASAGAAVAGAALAGCSTKSDASDCPRLAVLDDVGKLTKFREGAGRDLTDVAYTARVAKADGFCTTEKSSVKVEMTVQLVVERGPAATGAPADLQYFVAITDAARRVIAKEVFPARIPFEANQRISGSNEEIEERIPLPAGAEPSDYSIVVGFQLSPEEIEYNRRRGG
jgi:hypothetical protein